MKYINKLSDKEWNEILKEVDCTLDVNNTTGSHLPYIDKRPRNGEKEADNYLLHVVDNNSKTNFIKYMMSQAGMNITPMLKDAYNMCSDLVEVNDFCIKKLSFFINQDDSINQKLQKKFTAFMQKKFPTYKKDYNKYISSAEPEMAD